MDSDKGYSPAKFKTTVNGLKHLLKCLEYYDQVGNELEPWDYSLHHALVKILKEATND